MPQQGAARENGDAFAEASMEVTVYIVRCADGSYYEDDETVR